jgi:hypothetical protein
VHRETFHEGPDSWRNSSDSWFQSNNAVEAKTKEPEGSLATIDLVIHLLETAPAINKVTARKRFAETFRRLAGCAPEVSWGWMRGVEAEIVFGAPR